MDGREGRRQRGREEWVRHLFMPLFKTLIKYITQVNRKVCIKH